jgi:hypothetical protein
MKIAAAKVPLPVLVAFLVAAEKTVTICLLVRASATEDRRETRSAVPVEVRAFRIEALTSSPIAGPGQQAILVTPLIGVGAVPIAAIVGGVVNPRDFVCAVAIPILAPLAISFPIIMATTVTISVTIPVAVLVAVSVPVAAPVPGAVISGALSTFTIATNPITAATTITRTNAAPAIRTAAASA